MNVKLLYTLHNEYANEPQLHSLTAAQRSNRCRSHVDLIGYKVVCDCDVRITSDFKPCFWDCVWFIENTQQRCWLLNYLQVFS